MKYNEDIHPCYKSIGEKIEKMTDGDIIGFIRDAREDYVTCWIGPRNSLYVESYPTEFVGNMYENELTEEEIEFVKEQGELKFNIGAKDEH